ncbi:MAG: hypothetical protein EYR95_18660 [Phormidium sp. SL48-SHIP]|nr:MAG: hypothetical protein EYR95_18660 [Phormidium sp. SL48-SHIP]
MTPKSNKDAATYLRQLADDIESGKKFVTGINITKGREDDPFAPDDGWSHIRPNGMMSVSIDLDDGRGKQKIFKQSRNR